AGRRRQRPAEPSSQTAGGSSGARASAFLGKDAATAVSAALGFTLAVPGVHTAIVGTTRPERWQHNLALLGEGPLAARTFEQIRTRWREIADDSWVGQV